MPCYKPGRGIQAPDGALTYYGHLQIAAGRVPTPPPNYKSFPLPCGKCTGCRLERSRQTAVRLVHEAQLHELTSFVTLTYRDDQLPCGPAQMRGLFAPDAAQVTDEPQYNRYTRTRAAHAHENHASLLKSDLRGFTLRLYSDVRRRSGKGVRYYACGEYGDLTHRPHYHIAIFGEDFSDDRVKWKHSNGNQLWRSSRLARLWPHGDADIGALTFESAAYIARYIMKKVNGTKAEDHYRRIDREGNPYWLTPEFNVMSRRPGIAKAWFDEFHTDVYPSDQVISRGHPAKPPRYYDILLDRINPYLLAGLKEHREQGAALHAADQTPARLEARETVALAKLAQNKRSLE